MQHQRVAVTCRVVRSGSNEKRSNIEFDTCPRGIRIFFAATEPDVVLGFEEEISVESNVVQKEWLAEINAAVVLDRNVAALVHVVLALRCEQWWQSASRVGCRIGGLLTAPQLDI